MGSRAAQLERVGLQDSLRRLAEWQTDDGSPKVLSLYVNLDPSNHATVQDRESELKSLLDEAQRATPKRVSADCVERVRKAFANEVDAIDSAHGLAVFCSDGDGLLEMIKLARPIERRAVFDASPHIRPLVEQLSSDTWCILLANRREGRILLGSRDVMGEAGSVSDEVSGRHDQGGWSQANYQRANDKEVADHIKNVAAELFDLYQRTHFDRLLIGATEELAAEIKRELHPYVRATVAGRISVDVAKATIQDVQRESRTAMEAYEHAREREALNRFVSAVGSGTRGASGIEPVLDALNHRRVDTLLVASDFQAPGVACPQCRWMGTQGLLCPVDESALMRKRDVVEDAIESAVLQAATIVTTHHFPEDLASHGSIGGVFRY